MTTGLSSLVSGNRDSQKETNWIMQTINEYIKRGSLPTVYLSVADANEIVKFIKEHNLEKEAEKYDFYYRLREQTA